MKEQMTILLIDQDARTREEFRILLTNEGYDIETASGISDAVSRMKNAPICCIIMDENLTAMNGCDAVPIVKAVVPKVPIIMTASVNTKELEAKIRRQDVFYYYIKSFDRKELKAAVRNAFTHWTEVAK